MFALCFLFESVGLYLLPNLGNFSYCYFEYFFSSIFFLLSFWYSSNMLDICYCTGPWAVFIYFPVYSVSVIQTKFYWSVFNFTWFYIICCLHSTIESFQWGFQKVENLTGRIQYLFNQFYDNCFKFLSDNSNIWFILVLALVLFSHSNCDFFFWFLVWWEIFNCILDILNIP